MASKSIALTIALLLSVASCGGQRIPEAFDGQIPDGRIVGSGSGSEASWVVYQVPDPRGEFGRIWCAGVAGAAADTRCTDAEQVLAVAVPTAKGSLAVAGYGPANVESIVVEFIDGTTADLVLTPVAEDGPSIFSYVADGNVRILRAEDASGRNVFNRSLTDMCSFCVVADP